MSNWINVNDRLPDKEGEYLCYISWNDGSGFIKLCRFAKNLYSVDHYDFRGVHRSGWYGYDSEYGYFEQHNVTHWQPLPNPPESEVQEDE